MSKFFKALEQANRDRALRQAPPADAFSPAEAPLPESGRAAVADLRKVDALTPPLPDIDLTDGVDERLVSLITPAAFEAEQYRALRHVIEQRRRTTNVQVVAVSSPCAGDGKTITAINLAGAFAQAPELRVLLIDADLRRPAIGRLLNPGDNVDEGLVGAIIDPELTLARVTQRLMPFNLSVVHAGQTPPSPYEVLKSPKLGKLMEEARRHYDYVFIDTPPLTPIQDCRVIGRWVDGFLVVVAAHRTPRQPVADALTALDKAKVLGFVFNEDDRSTKGPYSAHNSYNLPSAPAARSHRGALMRAVGRVGESLRRRGDEHSATRSRWRGPR